MSFYFVIFTLTHLKKKFGALVELRKIVLLSISKLLCDLCNQVEFKVAKD